MHTRALATLALASSLLGCGGKGAEPAAPAPGGELLTYQPDAFAGSWRLTSRFISRPGAVVDIDAGAEITLRFAPAGPSRLDIFLEEMVVSGHMGAQPLDQRINQELTPIPGAFTTPVSAITLDEHGAVTGVPNPDNIFTRGGADLTTTAIFLIPPTPAAPVAIGAGWTATRIVPTSDEFPDVEAEIQYRLAGVDACPPPLDGRCARITCTADTGDRTMTVSGESAEVRYELEGQSLVQLGGALVDASARMMMRISIDGATQELDGELGYQRVAR